MVWLGSESKLGQISGSGSKYIVICNTIHSTALNIFLKICISFCVVKRYLNQLYNRKIKKCGQPHIFVKDQRTYSLLTLSIRFFKYQKMKSLCPTVQFLLLKCIPVPKNKSSPVCRNQIYETRYRYPVSSAVCAVIASNCYRYYLPLCVNTGKYR